MIPQDELRARYGRSQDLVPFIATFKDQAVILRDYTMVCGIGLQGESDALRPIEEIEEKKTRLAMMFAKTLHDYQIFVGCRQQRFEEIKNNFDSSYKLWEDILHFTQRVYDYIPEFFSDALQYIQNKADEKFEDPEKLHDFAAQRVDTGELSRLLYERVGQPPYTGPSDLMRTLAYITKPIFIARWGTLPEDKQAELSKAVRERLATSIEVLKHYLQLIVEQASFYEQHLMLHGPPLHYLAFIVPERPMLPKRGGVLTMPSEAELDGMYTRLKQKLDVLIVQLSAHFKTWIMSADEILNVYSSIYQHGMTWRAGTEDGSHA
jgi:hypothetical protein